MFLKEISLRNDLETHPKYEIETEIEIELEVKGIGLIWFDFDLDWCLWVILVLEWIN